MADAVHFDRTGDWGVITLDRPDALNALTWEMVAKIRERLVDWERSPGVRAVLVKGAGEKAFCAGGDIRWLYDNARRDPAGACGFFRDEYRMNALIHHYSKPYVALIDGIVMGGGVGLSVHGDFRVVGDRTLFAMPETAIGLFPDVGGGYFLPRLRGGVGLYFGLTGARAKAADCMAAGIATHYVPSDRIGAMYEALIGRALGARAHAEIEGVIESFSGDPGHSHLNDLRPEIDRLFTGRETFDALLGAVREDGHDVAGDIARILGRMSPTSLKLTFEQLKRGATLDFDHVMRMEFRIVRRVMEGHDFYEGVRSAIIDKDKNPHWEPSRLEEVTDAAIERYFAPLDAEELVLP